LHFQGIADCGVGGGGGRKRQVTSFEQGGNLLFQENMGREKKVPKPAYRGKILLLQTHTLNTDKKNSKKKQMALIEKRGKVSHPSKHINFHTRGGAFAYIRTDASLGKKESLTQTNSRPPQQMIRESPCCKKVKRIEKEKSFSRSQGVFSVAE